MKRSKENSSVNGQSLIEFALIVPILLVLLFLIIDLGRVVYVFSTIQNSAREGARFGVIEPTNFAGIEDRVRRSASGLDQSALQVTTPYFSDDTIQVRIQYQFRIFTPFLPSLFGLNQFQLNTRATMYLEK